MGPLFWRLLLWFCLANVITLVATVGITRQLVRQFYQPEPAWTVLAKQAAALYVPAAKHPVAALKPWRDALHRHQISVGLLDASGQVLVSPPHWVLRYRSRLSAAAEVKLHPRPGITLVGQAVTGPDGQAWRFIGVQYPPHGHGLRWLPFAIEILVSLCVIGVVGWWVARSIGRPVGAVQQAARRFARGELDARVGASVAQRAGELGQLGRDFDHMADRVQSLLERQRGVLQDVSHELRSPLTRLGLTLELARGEAGAAAQTALDRAEREIGRLDKVIGEVLELSRMEVQLPALRTEQLDFASLTRDCVSDAQQDAGQARRWALQLEATVRIDGNPALLARAVGNLLNNAVKFSPTGGEIAVRVGTTAQIAWLEITDAGPGVPEEELGSLFRPFFRGSNGARAAGHGLGLAIVARIASAHGGSVAAHNRPQGGLCVRLELPLAVVA